MKHTPMCDMFALYSQAIAPPNQTPNIEKRPE